MNPILPQEKAKEECFKLMEELDNSPLGRRLMNDGCGRMFGVLVCSDSTIIRAFSGELEGRYLCEGFVPPLFDVGEYNRIIGRYDRMIKGSENHRKLSEECWEEIKSLYRFTCFDGTEMTISSIFPNFPTGTGDCCAPRLLNYAFKNNLKPVSMCEFFYGSGSKAHKSFHGPCDSRCRKILPVMTGLDILYQDNDIVVVNKSAGMLSIEGRGPDKQDCIASRVRNFFPSCIAQPCVHRLDQATGGLMVLGLTQKAHDTLSSDFENRLVHKEYEALVEGIVPEQSGVADIPIRADIGHRPLQVVDYENGKSAVTYWRRLSVENRFGRKVTRLNLTPHTGRTHQIRLHCKEGLGHPILGDSLYGEAPSGEISRLMLQACVLEFTHPSTGERMRFEIPAGF